MTDPEDMKNKYIHVLACSLNAVSLLLISTAENTEKTTQVMSVMCPFVQNPSFWKIPKNKHPLVRAHIFCIFLEIYSFKEGTRCHFSQIFEKIV